MKHNVIYDFWFNEIDPKFWFKKDDEFDQMLRDRFLDIHQAAAAGELYMWRETAHGRLAEIIVLDQFSRNLFRETPQAFLYDPMALTLSQEAIHGGAHKELNAKERSFLYMPFMHSESPFIHQVALKLFSDPELKGNLEFEIAHKKIIDRFGRYPHRNKALGRQSTPEEIEFLKQPGSSF